MEYRAFQLILAAQVERVDKVSVVGDGERALYMAHRHGLAVGSVHVSGGGVAHMANGDPALSEFREYPLGEHLVHQTKSLVGLENPAVVNNDSAAFLTPVLKRIQPEISGVRHIGRRIAVNAEYAAFLVDIT